MKKFEFSGTVLIMILGFSGCANAAPPSVEAKQPLPSMPTGSKLFDSILAADTALFELAFNDCDPQKMSKLVTEDMEFYHDKGGFIASNGAQFVEDYAKNCKYRAKPNAWRVRRVLERKTMTVYPVPGFGAIQDGYHLFFERKGEGPEKSPGRARFSQVWKWDAGQWKMARVLSYAHEAVEPEAIE